MTALLISQWEQSYGKLEFIVYEIIYHTGLVCTLFHGGKACTVPTVHYSCSATEHLSASEEEYCLD